MSRFLSNIKASRNILILYGVLIILFIIGMSASSTFIKPENLTNIINQAIPLGIVALGQTIVLLVAGLDLSVGSLVSIATVLGATVIHYSAWSTMLYLLIMILLGIAYGLTNGLLVAKLKLHPLIATLSTGLVGSGIALLIMPTPGGYIPYSSVGFLSAGFGLFKLPMLYFFLISGALYFVLHHMRVGRYIYAVGANPKSAEAAGINVTRITITAYVLSALLAGLGGVFLACRIYSGAPTVGDSFTLDSVIAVLIGGTSFLGGIGGIGGTIAGVLLMTLVGNLLNLLHVQPFYHYIVRGVLFVIAVTAYNVKWRQP